MTDTQLPANESGASKARKPQRKAADKPESAAPKPQRKAANKPKALAHKPPKLAKTAARMYIGPNVGKGQLAQYTIFRGELPRHVQLLIEQTKELDILLVPVSLSAKAIKKMNMPGTVEHRAAQKVRG